MATWASPSSDYSPPTFSAPCLIEVNGVPTRNARATAPAPAGTDPTTALSMRPSTLVAPLPSAMPRTPPVGWPLVVALAWLAGVLVQVWRVGRDVGRSRHLVAEATPATQEVRSMAASLAARLGLRNTPEVRVSGQIEAPQVTGFLRATVLLPDRWLARFTGDELAMTLCHELAHVRRHDLLLGAVPALAERILLPPARAPRGARVRPGPRGGLRSGCPRLSRRSAP